MVSTRYTCASQDAVMRIPELFQMILLCLDQRSLLTSAQRVNKYWHSTIQNTPAIQQALFFKAFPASYDGPPVFNPLLMEIFSDWIPYDWDSDYKYRERNAVVLEKAFESLLPTTEHHRMFRQKRASWTRMLVRQPPIRTLCVWHQLHRRGGNSHVVKKKRCRRGLRMGKLYDISICFPLTVYWEGWVQGETACYEDHSCHHLDKNATARLNRIAGMADLTVHTSFSQTCMKPQPPYRPSVKYWRGIEIPKYDTRSTEWMTRRTRFRVSRYNGP
ncbi:hypothetical protein BGW36DRAFT_372514 [Talaromyces proteolyticus]|uniref:F-box domain-containing protein n=1 Tax=Talaromyces proteolyticus TaxID=1131652 RepID=A0AAD4L306_9EURO|nr:uncharacterized protein BGW36DRAFT_372514 [Talaromyces proteolyticus]KAH8702284.1 hypothetical protein BGW36DRAFT_372514 [Talaromyces proteolyticus]